mmetsp:Transcript_37355/g.116314  ORF Transcript_37355/g.116314 Transcript_37355/m.116314 type:complete len:260 (-) Transcript_37355:56-835(-)
MTSRLKMGRMRCSHLVTPRSQSSKWPPYSSRQSSFKKKNMFTRRRSLVLGCLLKSAWTCRKPPCDVAWMPAPLWNGSACKSRMPVSIERKSVHVLDCSNASALRTFAPILSMFWFPFLPRSCRGSKKTSKPSSQLTWSSLSALSCRVPRGEHRLAQGKQPLSRTPLSGTSCETCRRKASSMMPSSTMCGNGFAAAYCSLYSNARAVRFLVTKLSRLTLRRPEAGPMLEAAATRAHAGTRCLRHLETAIWRRGADAVRYG